MYLLGTSSGEFWWDASGAVRLTAYSYLSKSDTIAGLRSIYPPWYIATYSFYKFGLFWQAIHLFSHFSGGSLIPEDTLHSFPVILSAIRRYACYPLITVSLYVIYLSWYFCIINPQYRLSTCFTSSESSIVLPCTYVVLLILQVKHTPQTWT